MDDAPAVIRARNRRQAMDWSLVLASQEIPTTIERAEDHGWVLLVLPSDFERAVAHIRQFEKENRGATWRRQLELPAEAFHSGGLFPAVLLVALYVLTASQVPALQILGEMNSAAVRAGEWWRLFSAMLLHADLAHLIANATMGFLLFGLAMAHYGPGGGLLASWLAGAAGNLLGLALYPEPHRSVGASGAVMGALGLIAIHSVSHWRNHSVGGDYAVRTALGGVLLFVLLGMDPGTDVLAHLGGFLGGLLIGGALVLLPKGVLNHPAFDRTCAGALTLALLLTTALALTSNSPFTR